MSWVITSLGLAGVGAGMNYINGKTAQDQKKDELMANAEQIRYSPWTGMKSSVQGMNTGSPTAGAIGGAMQGGLTGAMLGSQFKNQTPMTPAMAPGPEATQGGLGSTDYARQLGDQANQFQASMSPFQKPNLYNGSRG